MKDIKYYCNKKDSGINASQTCMLTGNPCFIRAFLDFEGVHIEGAQS